MGALGAVVKVAAPEAAVAGAAAGAVKGRRKPVPDPRAAAPGSEAARQRQAVEDVKAARKPEPEPEHEDQADEHEDQADEHGGGPSFGGMSVPSTGGGFVLGVIGWALLRAWIGTTNGPSGAAGVKALLRAKFLNKTTS